MTLTVAVVTQDDPFYIPVFFEEFFATLPAAVDVKSVTCLEPFDESTLDLARRMYGFYGPVNFCKRSVQFALRKALDGVGDRAYSVSTVANAHGVPVESRATVTDGAFATEVAEHVDVVLSVSAPEIFDEQLLDAPSWGCLNVHTAELPNYRGMMPTFWALYHGDDEVGITVHTMETEIDEGDAVRRDRFEVSADATLDDVIVEGKRRGGRTAALALGDVARDDVTATAMTGEGSYFSFPTPEERREFQRRGRELL